jgi:endonuclease/exonuclease/phosphatase family metal-dependent hydrolase
MTYNVYESGANAEFMDVLKEENADILLLVETGTWGEDNHKLLNQYTNELNRYFKDEKPYQAVIDEDENFETTGVAILSRFNITQTIELEEVRQDDKSMYDVTHDFLVSDVDLFGWKITFAVSHLKCCDGETNEYRRDREQEGLNNYFDTLGEGRRIIYGGDLNSYYPGEGTWLGNNAVDMVINSSNPLAPQKHNFTDVHKALNPGDPGDSFLLGGRIDYIFVNKHLTDYMVNSKTGETASAYDGSDHLSVELFMDLSHLMPEPTIQYTTMTDNGTSLSSDQNNVRFLYLFSIIAVFVSYKNRKSK